MRMLVEELYAARFRRRRTENMCEKELTNAKSVVLFVPDS